MKHEKRNDPHCPRNLKPGDYEWILSFVRPAHGVAGMNMDALMALRRENHGRFFQGGGGDCQVCGARYLRGDVFRHVPTGQFLLVGWECAEAMEAGYNRARAAAHLQLNAQRRGLRAAVKRETLIEARRAARAERAAEFLAETHGLAEALKLEHRIIIDLRSSLAAYGRLTPKQVELAMKLAEDAKKPVGQVPVVEKRIQVEGVVKSTKTEDSGYGETMKMLVEVNGEAGSYRLFGTVPDSLLDGKLLIGARVRFAAKVERSRNDPSFGFFSRPTRGERVSEGVEAR